MEIAPSNLESDRSETLSGLEAAVAFEEFVLAETLSASLAIRSARDPRFQALRGRVLLVRSDYLGAISLFHSAIGNGENSVDTRLWLSDALQKLGRDVDALAVLYEGLELFPSNFELNFELGCLAVAHGEPEGAISYLQDRKSVV